MPRKTRKGGKQQPNSKFKISDPRHPNYNKDKLFAKKFSFLI